MRPLDPLNIDDLEVEPRRRGGSATILRPSLLPFSGSLKSVALGLLLVRVGASFEKEAYDRVSLLMRAPAHTGAMRRTS